jgi:hypothetical protein
MNKFVLSMIAAFALCVATAVAQSSGAPGSQGTQGSSPTMSQTPGANPQPGMNQPGSTQTDQNSGSMGNSQADKGEKKLKGCVEAQGGQAMLQTKKGKEVALTGQDVSAHNGHEVEVKGTWAGSGSMSQTSSGSSGEKTFNVTDVKMISETCKGSKEKGSSNMGSGTGGSYPSGSGSSTTSPSSTGSTNGSTQPQ